MTLSKNLSRRIFVNKGLEIRGSWIHIVCAVNICTDSAQHDICEKDEFSLMNFTAKIFGIENSSSAFKF